jgi:RNA polymerase sigma-70 factor (ECF subfamily)
MVSGTHWEPAMNRSDETETLEQQVIHQDDPQAIGQLILKYQGRLERVVAFRMDARLRARVDATDVLQDAFVEATQRIDDYKACSDKMSFFLWLRFITLQKLTQLHRHHLGVKARDAGRDVGIFQHASGQATSVVLAAQLLGKMTSPSHAAMREENKRKLEQAFAEMEEIDREALALRHFEHLSKSETAQLLSLTEAAASNRYIRAVRRLKSVLDRIQHGASGIFHSD